jgi:hypothetical protein
MLHRNDIFFTAHKKFENPTVNLNAFDSSCVKMRQFCPGELIVTFLHAGSSSSSRVGTFLL